MLVQETNKTMLTQKMKRNMQWCYKHTTQQRENYQQKIKIDILLAHNEKYQQCYQQEKEDKWLKFCKHCQKQKNTNWLKFYKQCCNLFKDDERLKNRCSQTCLKKTRNTKKDKCCKNVLEEEESHYKHLHHQEETKTQGCLSYQHEKYTSSLT